MKKIILDLCGGTGSWSKPYKDAGYDVVNVTLPEYDVRKWFQYTLVNIESVYGILAAPPCTQFSLARTTAKTPRDFKGGMEVVRACMDIIWEFHPTFWAMENPVGLLRQFMGKPAMTFQPFMYGDRYTKKTDLWGYFNEPVKDQKYVSEDQMLLMSENKRELPELPEGYIPPDGKQAARRAMTPQGFAKAFYEANQ